MMENTEAINLNTRDMDNILEEARNESHIDSEMNRGKERTRKKSNPGLLPMVLPFSSWMVLFVAIPLLLVVILSFLSRGPYGWIEYNFTLSNYARIMNPLYLNILWKSLLIAFFTTVFCLLVGYPFAYFISLSPKKYRIALLMMIIIPFWTNSLIRTYAWIMLLRTEGIINSFLLALGIISAPFNLLYNEGAVFVGLVYTLFPFMVLPLYTSIEKLDKSLLEAARDLGAVPWKAFLHITLPLTAPGIIAGSILVFIPTLGYFFIPDLMGGSKAMYVCNLIKNQFLTARDWPFGAALSVLLILLTFGLVNLYTRVTGGKKGLEVF